MNNRQNRCICPVVQAVIQIATLRARSGRENRVHASYACSARNDDCLNTLYASTRARFATLWAVSLLAHRFKNLSCSLRELILRPSSKTKTQSCIIRICTGTMHVFVYHLFPFLVMCEQAMCDGVELSLGVDEKHLTGRLLSPRTSEQP